MIYKNQISHFFKNWKNFFKNWKNWYESQINLSEKKFYWHNLNNIDIKKVWKLNKDELKFIIDNFIFASKDTTNNIENSIIKFSWLRITSKKKIIRNKKLVEDRILINNYIKNLSNKNKEEIKDIYLNISEKQKILRDWFQAWIIDEYRKNKIFIPNFNEITPKKELDIKLVNNYLK
jgi:hypothetical protein